MVDNANYMDLLVLSKEINEYFGKYYKKLIKDNYVCVYTITHDNIHIKYTIDIKHVLNFF